MELKLIVDTRNLACPLCREGVAVPDDIHKCEHCGHLMHEACWKEFGKCGAMECAFGPPGPWVEFGGERVILTDRETLGDYYEIWETSDNRQVVLWDSSYQGHLEFLRENFEDYVPTEILAEWAVDYITRGRDPDIQLDCWLEGLDDVEGQSNHLGADGDYDSVDAVSETVTTYQFAAFRE